MYPPCKQREVRMMRIKFIATALLFIGACANKEAGNNLLARDLIFEKIADGWTYEVILDPRISRHPEIARLIMAAKADGIKKPDDACDLSASGEPNCFETHDISVAFAGSRLLSLLDEIQVDRGMHPVVSYEGHIFDVADKREIPFETIFTDWSEAKSRMQKQFCSRLEQERPDAEECPAIEKQGLSLHQSGVFVNTHDYQLGAYPLGREAILLSLDGEGDGVPEFRSLLKDEYKAEFDPSPPKANSTRVADPNSSTPPAETPIAFGVGNCVAGDELSFRGGWAVGMANPDPLPLLQKIADSSFDERLAIAAERPLRTNWRNMCTGVQTIEGMTVTLQGALDGKDLRTTRFLTVFANPPDDGGRTRSCRLGIMSEDVSCLK